MQHVLALLVTALVLVACDEPDKPAGSSLAELASANNPSLMGGPTASGAPAPPRATGQVKPAVRRPDNDGDLVLTEERRSKIEAAYPESKGFLDVADSESRLYEYDFSRGKEAPAVAAFDSRARDKWVLFTGNMVNPQGGSFGMPVRYTPRDAHDPMGLTSTWFLIELEDISGYDASEYKQGDLAVVLAKYEGGKKAKGGYDLILLDRWFAKTVDDPAR
jgi:hypothetical protein